MKFDFDTINELYWKENGLSILKDIPDGEFIQQADQPIYFFQFKLTSACSVTTSNLHKDLPVTVSRKIERFCELEHTFAGTKSFFFHFEEAVVEDGKLNLLSGALQNYYDESSEADRTNRLIKELYKWSFNNKKPIGINGYSKNVSRFCPFTGGGNILISGDKDVALILTGSGDANNDDDNDYSSEIIDNKVWEKTDMRQQLQANMILAAVSVLRKKVFSNDISMSDIASMTKLSCYGFFSRSPH